jgi:4-amino-4-deoxy-L-arabinose transferase-like glycosyltransferase
MRQIVLLTFAAFVVRMLVAQFVLGGLSREYQGDESDYVKLAIHFVQGLGFSDNAGRPTSLRTPGLPLLLTLPIWLTSANIGAIRLFMCLLESLMIPAVYLLARSVTGSEKIGLVAGAIAVVFPSWMFPSGAILTDIIAGILTCVLVWMLVESRQRRSVSWIAGAGTIWGIATLIRPVSLSYAPAIIAWLFLLRAGRRDSLVAIGAVIIAFASTLAPWTIRNFYVHGTFVLISTQAGTELYKGNNPMATGILAFDHTFFDENLAQIHPEEMYPNEAVRSKKFQADAVKFIVDNPRRFAELCFLRLIELYKTYSPRVPLLASIAVTASFGAALPFFLIQVVRRGWDRGPEMLMLLIILCQTATHVVFTSVVRYRIPVEPLIVVLAIQGFLWSLTRLGVGQRKSYNSEQLTKFVSILP